MIIRRRSPLTGTIFEWDLPVTQEMLDRWQAGELIQSVMPHLTMDQREFIKTGMSPKDWDVLWHEDDDDEKKQNPLEPKIPDHLGVTRLNGSTLEPVEGIYLTDNWRIAADFAMGQSIQNYVPAFMERFHKTSIPITHPMLHLPDSTARLEDLLQRHDFKSHKRWDDEKYDYSDFGVLVPLVFELDVSGLPLHLDPEVELGLNISYYLFRKHCISELKSQIMTPERERLRAEAAKVVAAGYLPTGLHMFRKSERITYEEARKLTIGRGPLHQLLRRRDTVDSIIQMLTPQFLKPLLALENILGEEYARTWFATSVLDETPFPDAFVEAAGMFYTPVEIPFDRVVSISSMRLPHGLTSYADAKEGEIDSQVLYQASPATKTLYHGTTIVTTLLAFPELEDLLEIPLDLKEHWYEMQLHRQADEDLNFDPSGFLQ